MKKIQKLGVLETRARYGKCWRQSAPFIRFEKLDYRL